MWKFNAVVVLVILTKGVYGSDDLMPCPPNSTPVTFDQDEGQDMFVFTTTETCYRIPSALAGSRNNMRCPIDTTTSADFQAYMDIHDPADLSTNYLQSLCFSVRHVDRVTVFMGRLGGPSLTYEEIIPNSRRWTEVCLPEPYIGLTYDYFDWLIKLHIDKAPTRSLMKVKNLELKACNFIYAE